VVDRTLIPVEERTPPPRIAEPGPAPRTGIGLGPFLILAAQVGLVLGVALLYRVEIEGDFPTIAALIFLGFGVHSWLAPRLRVPFFVLLTATALALVLGWDAAWVAALGLGILALCHLPVAWWARLGLVLAAGAALAAVQSGALAAPWGSTVLVVLGAMFMFRLAYYLYDLKTERTPADPWRRVAYFFLLPNVTFPLFPVIDYKTFLRTYYDTPAAEIYQKGVYWMLRGVTHLLLYRIVYQLLPRADTDLGGALGVYVFAAMTYGLYLRVSGLFHLVVGSLCLFGFNLPPTNHHYYLASSFSDLWRRVNIYWKDYMMTLVFYPVFMQLRRWSMTARLVAATVVVVVITWFLHSYQWFWLRGELPITGTDMLFWGTLGAGLTISTVREARRGRKRRLGAPAWSWRAALGLSLRTLGFFSMMGILWTLWYSDSIAEWGYRMLRVRESEARDWAALAGLLGAVIAAGVAAQWLNARGWGLARAQKAAWSHAPRTVVLGSLALLAVGVPGVHERVGRPLEGLVARAQSTKLNRIDAQRQERGYYEALSRANREGPADGGADPGEFLLLFESGAIRRTDDLRDRELVPSFETVVKGSTFRTNRWGLRDRDYEREKPPGTYRIALLGSSQVMGPGVSNDQTFENLVEDRLNRELAGRGFERFEILNFAVGGYGLLQILDVALQVVPPFQPDAVVYVAHPGEAVRLVDRLPARYDFQGDPDYRYVGEIMDRAGAGPGLPKAEFHRRLDPYGDDLVRWAYGRQVAAIRAQGALPVFVLLPIPNEPFRRAELDRITAAAREAGAIVLPMTGVYDGHDIDQIRVAEWDNHPNVLGHQLVAERLFSLLAENGEELGMVPAARDTVRP
jgi:hypothetical protein